MFGYENSMMVETLRNDAMMAYLLDALEQGQDIGHYGRLVFVMVARHFGATDELVALLTQDKTCSEEAARGLIAQVEETDYSPAQAGKDYRVRFTPRLPDHSKSGRSGLRQCLQGLAISR